ncbi:MAG: AAA family ATPase [Intestinibacter bartlettii]
MCNKKIIILDEPITGLDPTVTREMYNLIKEINKKGITIIMVSHDINFAINNASKILHLKKNIKFFGNTEDYAKSEVGKKFIGGAEID